MAADIRPGGGKGIPLASEGRQEARLTRKELIGSAAGAASALALSRYAGLAAGAVPRRRGKMNVLLFITDQDRAIQHFPRGWAARNLPGYRRLQRHGISFNNAFTNACMCSPARSTLFSGYFPAQHGVKYTLEADMPAPEYPQVNLPRGLKNAASVMAAAGYNPVYKGKWHCSKPPLGQPDTPQDLENYGFARWNPPDGGANQDPSQAGGGSYNNDGRYMHSAGNTTDGTEGVLQYLTSTAAQQQPFFLVVSLVNPHDVLFYPKNFLPSGYDNTWLKGTIGLPETVNEDLRHKPRVQREFRRIFALTGRPKTDQQKRNYLNFYGNLIKSSDAYLMTILDTLSAQGLLDDTLVIKTADHGEMGLAHGSLRQKNFNFYEESLRVPLVYSNPKLFPRPRRSNALVSHVDFLPTLASLAGAPPAARADWQGRDYSRLIVRPRSRPVQDYTVFTYDDFQSGQKTGPYPRPPNHIVSIREQRWKLAKYYDPAGKRQTQWEMYDLKHDSLEVRNLAHRNAKRTKDQEFHYRRLQKKLARVEQTRLAPFS